MNGVVQCQTALKNQRPFYRFGVKSGNLATADDTWMDHTIKRCCKVCRLVIMNLEEIEALKSGFSSFYGSGFWKLKIYRVV